MYDCSRESNQDNPALGNTKYFEVAVSYASALVPRQLIHDVLDIVGMRRVWSLVLAISLQPGMLLVVRSVWLCALATMSRKVSQQASKIGLPTLVLYRRRIRYCRLIGRLPEIGEQLLQVRSRWIG